MNSARKSDVFRVYTLALFDPCSTGGRFHVYRECVSSPFTALLVPSRYDVYKRNYRSFYRSARAVRPSEPSALSLAVSALSLSHPRLTRAEKAGRAQSHRHIKSATCLTQGDKCSTKMQCTGALVDTRSGLNASRGSRRRRGLKRM